MHIEITSNLVKGMHLLKKLYNELFVLNFIQSNKLQTITIKHSESQVGNY